MTQTDRSLIQTEELNQELTPSELKTEPRVISNPDRTEQSHPNSIPVAKTPKIYPPSVQEMIDKPCTCTHGNPPCMHCYATLRLSEKDELIEAMAELRL